MRFIPWKCPSARDPWWSGWCRTRNSPWGLFFRCGLSGRTIGPWIWRHAPVLIGAQGCPALGQCRLDCQSHVSLTTVSRAGYQRRVLRFAGNVQAGPRVCEGYRVGARGWCVLGTPRPPAGAAPGAGRCPARPARSGTGPRTPSRWPPAPSPRPAPQPAAWPAGGIPVDLRTAAP